MQVRTWAVLSKPAGTFPPHTPCTYLDVAIRCPAVFDDCASSLLQGFLIWLQALQKERNFLQDQRQESSKSPKEKQQPQSCPCQQTLASHPVLGTLRHMPKTRGQLQSSHCCLHCTVLASSPHSAAIPHTGASPGRDGSHRRAQQSTLLPRWHHTRHDPLAPCQHL